MNAPEQPWWQKLLWLIGLWVMGVTVLGLAAYGMKLLMRSAGLA